jgi:hypothetical protein
MDPFIDAQGLGHQRLRCRSPRYRRRQGDRDRLLKNPGKPTTVVLDPSSSEKAGDRRHQLGPQADLARAFPKNRRPNVRVRARALFADLILWAA